MVHGLIKLNSHRPQVLGSENRASSYSFDGISQMVKSDSSPRSLEPEGSVSSFSETASSPSHTNTTGFPPYLKWAESLTDLLSDPDGVKLYSSYLEGESLSQLLQFWFACEGLKKQSDEKTVLKYIKVISRNFIVSKNLDLNDSIKKSIFEKMNSLVGDVRNIFDEAQEAIEYRMMNTTYPNFLKSETYLNYIQSLQSGYNGSSGSSSDDSSLPQNKEESKIEESETSGAPLSAAAPPPRVTLPTLHECSELDLALSSSDDKNIFLSKKDSILYTSNLQRKEIPSSSSFSSSNFPPFHAYGSTYNPVSRQDSEIQSQSSGALGRGDTTDDNYSSFTEGSSIALAISAKRHKQKRRSERKNMVENVRTNKEGNHPTIPRPNRQGQIPPVQLSPKEFAHVLYKKLQAYVDSQEREKKSYEMLNRKLNSMESDHRTNTTNDLESDQSILDEHVSRIWQDKTPVHLRSPGELAGRSRSPSRKLNHKISSSSSSSFPSKPGHQTLPNRRQRSYNAINGFRYDPSSTDYNRSNSTHHHQQQQQLHIQQQLQHYHNHSHHHPLSGDLAQHPSNNLLHKSYSELDAARGSRMIPQLGGGGGNRVQEWVQNVNTTSQSFSSFHDDEQRSIRTSPKSSRSYYKNRSRSQDRLGVTGWPASNSHMYPPTHIQLAEVNRRLQQQNPTSGTITTVMYTFSNESEGMPYRVKIQSRHVTLKQIRDNLPKNGRYRYYFKTLIDGEPCFEEERDGSALVPLWDEAKVVVQCRDDVI